MDLTNLSWIACDVFKYLLMVVGAVTLFRALCAFVTFLRIAFTRLTPQWIDKYGKGSWALVTGCTEGIGRAFCFELAELGFGLVLVSRNPSKLETLNKDIWKKYPNLNVVICVADFSKSNRSLYEHIISKISNLDVSLLVNNVGISHQGKSLCILGLFDQLTLENVEELIKVNIESMTYLTYKMIPIFK
jgi:17beta-estradiol 17-dehydrogenase / very-long-chain 3-oxoacyl-CoA reductase